MSWDKVGEDLESGPRGALKWLVLTVVVLMVIFGSLGFVNKYLSVNADRIITKQSFQYKEGMEQRAAILEANIAEVEAMLRRNPENRADLEAQLSVLHVQLRAVTINE